VPIPEKSRAPGTTAWRVFLAGVVDWPDQPLLLEIVKEHFLKGSAMYQSRNHRTRLLAIGLCGVAATLIAGCSSDSLDLNLEDNKGSMLTTQPGQAITQEMLLGKWDLDGELTNKANGKGDPIPSSVFKDMFGPGWKFEANGVLKFDTTGGYTEGSYKISGDKLSIRYAGGAGDTVYTAQFKDGFLYLYHAETQKYRVFEKSKFFDF
jgi:hypothetical protein